MHDDLYAREKEAHLVDEQPVQPKTTRKNAETNKMH